MPMPAAPFGLPTLDEIESLTPGERAVFRGVDWDFYERLHDLVGERPALRIAFDGSDLEMMWVGPFHAYLVVRAASLVEVLTEELDINFRSMGATTWKRPAVRRGIEADKSFYFSPEKVAAAAALRIRRSNDIADYPDPDLAIDINVSEPQIDRPGIYAAMKVSEVWRMSGSSMAIGRLTDQGTYTDVETSGFLPIRAHEVARWVFEEDSPHDLAWKREVRAWVRAELSDRRAR